MSKVALRNHLGKGSSRSWQRGACIHLGAMAVLACGGTTEPSEKTVAISAHGAALTAQENTERTVRGVLEAGGFLADSQALASSLGSLTSSESCQGGGSVCVSGDTTCEPVAEETCVTEPALTQEDMVEARQELHDSLDELLRVLREEVFIEANLESDDGTHAVYRLPASLLCSEEPTAGPEPLADQPEPEPALAPEVNEECEAYTQLQPRLRLSSPSEGNVDVDVLLTAEKHNPITLQLYSDRVGLVSDLGEVKASIEASGEEIEELQELSGEVQLQLVRNSAQSYSVTLGFLSDLHVKAGSADEVTEVYLAATSPAAELELDGAAKTITGSYNYGALNVLAPLSAFMGDSESTIVDPVSGELVTEPAKVYTGMIDMVLGGLTGSITFDGSTDVLRFVGIGLGEGSTTVKHDDNTLLQLDVNPEDGRKFDLTVTKVDEDRAQLTFSPTLDVRLLLNFAHIADQVDDVAAFLLDDQLRLWFEGENPSIEPSEGQLRVVSGTLHLDSSSAPESSLSVEAGACLIEKAETETAPTALPAGFEVGICQ